MGFFGNLLSQIAQALVQIGLFFNTQCRGAQIDLVNVVIGRALSPSIDLGGGLHTEVIGSPSVTVTGRKAVMVIAPLAAHAPLDFPLAIRQRGNTAIVKEHDFGMGSIVYLALAQHHHVLRIHPARAAGQQPEHTQGQRLGSSAPHALAAKFQKNALPETSAFAGPC